MSIFTKIEAAEKSTVAWLEKEITAIEGKAPAIEKVVDAGLAYIKPVLQIGLTAIGDPGAAAIVGTVFNEAQKDLAVASALVTDFGATSTAAGKFVAVQNDLSALLTAGHVKSATSVAAVKKAVSEVGVLGSAVQLAASAITAAATAPATPAANTAAPGVGTGAAPNGTVHLA